MLVYGCNRGCYEGGPATGDGEGRHYPSDRCPVASDGKEKGEREEGKGKRGKELTNWQALHASAIFGVTPEFDKRLDASGYDSARARPLPVQRVPHPPGPRQKIVD